MRTDPFVILTLLTIVATDSIVVDSTNGSACVPHENSSDDFPGDIFTPDQRRHGGFVLHGLVAIYFFLLIAIACNDYFIPSVGCICRDLNLRADVAGATFMAFATVTPELFTNLIGTFITRSDLGVGTVLGSVIFNTLGVPAFGGLATTVAIKLPVYPLARDCLSYTVVIGVLWAILWDGQVHWYEAVSMAILYCVYCVIMYHDETLSKNIMKILKRNPKVEDVPNSGSRGVDEVGSPSVDQSPAKEFKYTLTIKGQGDLTCPTESDATIFTKPDGVLQTSWRTVTLPITFLLRVTVPNVTTHRSLYPLTFFMCIVWIGVASYVVTWMVTLIGNTFSISDSTMGLTFLALSGGLPEACSSVINARLGEGSMSISNSLGSNTLGILLCLGLPWLVRCLLPADLGGGPVEIHSPGLVYNTAAQLACVLVLFVGAAANNFHFDRVLGSLCLVMYIICLAFIFAMENNMFGWGNENRICRQ